MVYKMGNYSTLYFRSIPVYENQVLNKCKFIIIIKIKINLIYYVLMYIVYMYK
jgi:hypothetical protein